VAEFRGPRLPGGVRVEVPVSHDGTGAAPLRTSNPYIALPDSRVNDDVIMQHFGTWNERWATYLDSYGYGNIFYPMTYQATGGADGGGFVWTDASRWRVDPPEDPDSILVAVNYWRWLFPPEWRSRSHLGETVDLSNTVLEVALRGRQLVLGPTHVTFWVLCNGSRWHSVAPLTAGAGRWQANRIELTPDPERWSRSWARDAAPPPFCLDKVESYGFALRGVARGLRPTGVLDMDEFRITRRTSTDR
jgi:hypothetical protein